MNESVILKLPSSLVKALRSRWVWVRGKRYLVMKKLDPVKVAWVIKEKEKGTSDNAIASVIKVSGRCIMRRKSSGSNFGIKHVVKNCETEIRSLVVIADRW